jgi:hypothetical protein
MFIRWLQMGIIDGIPKEVCDPHKNILAVCEQVGGMEKVKAWREAHKK